MAEVAGSFMEMIKINMDKMLNFSLKLGIKLAGIVLLIYLAGMFRRRLGFKHLRKVIKNMDEDSEAVLRSLITYTIWFVVILISLNILGVKIESLITSLGLMSVAIGFAAQATISNFISGIMIMFDRSVRIGDVIEVKGNVGTIHSIGILSTRIKTFDNILIRVPNREMLDSDVKNYTFFDIRRFELVIGVSYDTDIQKAREVIMDTLKSIDMVLDDPEPMTLIKEFADSSINIIVRAWSKRENLFTARDIAAQKIKEAFDEAGIEIPFPQVVVHMKGEQE